MGGSPPAGERPGDRGAQIAEGASGGAARFREPRPECRAGSPRPGPPGLPGHGRGRHERLVRRQAEAAGRNGSGESWRRPTMPGRAPGSRPNGERRSNGRPAASSSGTGGAGTPISGTGGAGTSIPGTRGRTAPSRAAPATKRGATGPVLASVGAGGGARRTGGVAPRPTPSSTSGARPPTSRATAIATSPAAPTVQGAGRRARRRPSPTRCATRCATTPRQPSAPDARAGAAHPAMASATRARQRAYSRGAPVLSATRSSAASSRSRCIQRPMSQTAGCRPNGTATTRCRRFIQSSRRSTWACSWATIWSSSASVRAFRSARGTTIIGRRKPRTDAATRSSTTASCARRPPDRALCHSRRRRCTASGIGRARIFSRRRRRRSRARRARAPAANSTQAATVPVTKAAGAPGRVSTSRPSPAGCPPAASAPARAGMNGSVITIPNPSQQSV